MLICCYGFVILRLIDAAFNLTRSVLRNESVDAREQTTSVRLLGGHEGTLQPLSECGRGALQPLSRNFHAFEQPPDYTHPCTRERPGAAQHVGD
ncbi:hypothetical protein AOQ73_39120 [Bradyrhizobium pachyrhizi]|nr:hypothetical protein AOQ73_39120 [Bradyrhizobium pachyrhizi]